MAMYAGFRGNQNCNRGHNILRRFDILLNFSFTTSEVGRNH